MNSVIENDYSRSNAVKYAMEHALNPNPNYKYFSIYGKDGGDCANFLSQSLQAGGVPMRFNFKNPWWYNNKDFLNVSNHTCSISWCLAHSLFWYLKNNQAQNFIGAKGLEVGNYNMLDIGDLIFFENSKGSIYHSAIVTSFLNNYPYMCHHSPEVLNIPFKTWGAYKIHFLKISL